MQDITKITLDGVNNTRLNHVDATNNERTASWANIESIEDETNLNIPSNYSIEKAKNWVDNGSKL